MLFAQFPLLEEAMEALGVAVWAMVEYEADDALATAAAVASGYAEQVLICTPDKDLGQCVVGDHVVQFDRRARKILDADAVRAKFGVSPSSIPDYLALVGDSADGFPGLPGWGAKSASAVLARFGHIESIPVASAEWELPSLRERGGAGADARPAAGAGAAVQGPGDAADVDRHRRGRGVAALARAAAGVRADGGVSRGAADGGDGGVGGGRGRVSFGQRRTVP